MRRICAIARRLKSSLPSNVVTGRIGAGEFAVLYPDHAGIHSIDQVVEHLIEELMVPYQLTTHLQSVNISIGVAALHARTSPQALIEAADVCLYAAKRSGRNCVIGERDERLLTAVAG